jgi:predicted Zn-ribbon and HTH transcriptional regulator
MSCKKCGSELQTEFDAEMNVHFPGPDGWDKAAVLLYPRPSVCLDCGFTEFIFPEKELPNLARGAAH